MVQYVRPEEETEIFWRVRRKWIDIRNSRPPSGNEAEGLPEAVANFTFEIVENSETEKPWEKKPLLNDSKCRYCSGNKPAKWITSTAMLIEMTWWRTFFFINPSKILLKINIGLSCLKCILKQHLKDPLSKYIWVCVWKHWHSSEYLNGQAIMLFCVYLSNNM